ncbi:MAG: BspA family leucine-rich repeat surface protein [Solobacterium sp.]|nr:BspA family leucine-rich repeat surface protein [Solobacterium sp.]
MKKTKTLKQVSSITLAILICLSLLAPFSVALSAEETIEENETIQEPQGEVTPESTPEVTEEPTPEVAPEITPESTPEVTPEPAPEVTPEVIEENTPTPVVEETPVPSEEPIEEVIVEENYPSFLQEHTIKDVTITVEAPEGVFPEGSTLSVEEVPVYVERQVSEALDEVREEEKNVAVSYTFDIKVLKDGIEVQPKDQSKVKVSFKMVEVQNENLTTDVYHIDDKQEAITSEQVTQLDTVTEEDTAIVETDGFSLYTVEFTYNQLTYVMAGDSDIPLSTILSYVGLNGEVSAVEVSNPTLFSASNENGVWMVHALQAFQTNEWMKVTIDGITYEIVVTDNIAEGSFDGLYWWISDSGILNIRPLNSATSPVSMTTVHSSAANWPWHSYRSQIKEVRFITNNNGVGVGLSGTQNFMFADCVNLEKVSFDGLEDANANGIARMFSNCPKLKEADLSKFTNEGVITNMQNMFNGCTSLEKVVLNNPDFKGATVNGGVMIANMFAGCTSLKEVDLSNIELPIRTSNAQPGDMFNDSKNLETVKMNNTKLICANKDGDFSEMFNNCPNLSTVEVNGFEAQGGIDFTSMFENDPALTTMDMSDVYVDDAQYMTNMFHNCTGLETLDVSGFGLLNDIVNMDGFVQGDTSLKTLVLDNLDNSAIGPTNEKHSVYEDLDPSIGAVEYGRELGVETCTSLETLSAQNSKVWMCYNDRGLPGDEYYNASNDTSILYFNDHVMTYQSDSGPVETIDSKRDYIDLVIDRDGINKHTTDPAQDPLPDASQNINIKDGDLNTNGAGFLAPGVYTITQDAWSEKHPATDPTYYRIAYIGEVPFTVEAEDVPELEVYKTDNYVWINTIEKNDWPTSGDYTINTGGNVKITYKNAAIDVNGKLHDVVITINSITFKELEKIPTDPHRYHDGNSDKGYYVTNNTYYRTILQASRSDGVTFRNYVRGGDPLTPWNAIPYLSGGSGTDIDFTIEIDGANPDTSFLYYADDLDVAYSQDWERPIMDDACYDNLPIENTTFGEGGEGFILGQGNDLGSVTFAEQTGLALVGNQVITTGTDPNTPWSEFYVKADATGSNYTWTSGVACTTYALRNTEKLKVGEAIVTPKKQLEGGTLAAGDFTFKLTPVSLPDGISQEEETATNNADGTITFNNLKFDAPVYTLDGIDYYPGTGGTNEHGQGEHNTYDYVYTLAEVIPDPKNPNIKYDETVHDLTVSVTTPETDEEMMKGLKVLIYVDGELVDNPDDVDGAWWSGSAPGKSAIPIPFDVFKNTVLGSITIHKEVTGPAINPDKEFEYTLSLPDLASQTIEDNYGRSYTLDASGNCTFTLKHNQTITFKKIPTGTAYTVTENDYSGEGYKTYVDGSEGRSSSGNVSVDGTTIGYTNELQTYDLTIDKTVSGNMGDKEEQFEFTIKITGPVSKEIEESVTTVVTSEPWNPDIPDVWLSGWYITEMLDPEKYSYVSIDKGYFLDGTFGLYEENPNDGSIHLLIPLTNAEIESYKAALKAETYVYLDGIRHEILSVDPENKVINNGSEWDVTYKDIAVENGFMDLSGVEGLIDNGDGTYTFTLGHEETITIPNIPYGYTYEVVEKDYTNDGYLTKVDGTEGRTATGTVEQDTAHSYENIRNGVVPTGVVTGIYVPFMGMFVLAIGWFILKWLKKAEFES